MQQVCNNKSIVCKLACEATALKDNIATGHILDQLMHSNISFLWIRLKGPGTSSGNRRYRCTISNLATIVRALCDTKRHVLLEASPHNRGWSSPCLVDFVKRAGIQDNIIIFCALSIHSSNNKSPSSYQQRVVSTFHLPPQPCNCTPGTHTQPHHQDDRLSAYRVYVNWLVSQIVLAQRGSDFGCRRVL